jgi:hypothetical protein
MILIIAVVMILIIIFRIAIFFQSFCMIKIFFFNFIF